MNDPNYSSTSSGGGFSFKIFGALLENIWKPQRKADQEREVKLLLDAVMLLRPEVLAEGYMLMRAPVSDDSSPSSLTETSERTKKAPSKNKEAEKKGEAEAEIVDVYSISDPTLSRFLSTSLQGDLICSLVDLKIGLPYVTNNNTPLIRSSKGLVQLGDYYISGSSGKLFIPISSITTSFSSTSTKTTVSSRRPTLFGTLLPETFVLALEDFTKEKLKKGSLFIQCITPEAAAAAAVAATCISSPSSSTKAALAHLNTQGDDPNNTNTAGLSVATTDLPGSAYDLLIDPLANASSSFPSNSTTPATPTPLHLQQQTTSSTTVPPSEHLPLGTSCSLASISVPLTATIATRQASSIEELPVGVTFLTLDRYVAFRRLRCGRVKFSFDPSRMVDLKSVLACPALDTAIARSNSMALSSSLSRHHLHQGMGISQRARSTRKAGSPTKFTEKPAQNPPLHLIKSPISKYYPYYNSAASTSASAVATRSPHRKGHASSSSSSNNHVGGKPSSPKTSAPRIRPQSLASAALHGVQLQKQTLRQSTEALNNGKAPTEETLTTAPAGAAPPPPPPPPMMGGPPRPPPPPPPKGSLRPGTGSPSKRGPGGKRLRAIHWSAIPSNRLSKTIWSSLPALPTLSGIGSPMKVRPNGAPSSPTPSSPSSSLNGIDQDEIEAIFSLSPAKDENANPNSSSTPLRKKVLMAAGGAGDESLISVLQLKRANNVGIVMSSQFKGLTPQEIALAIARCDVSIPKPGMADMKPVGAQLNTDRLKAIRSIFPLTEHESIELQKLREILLLAKKNGEEVPGVNRADQLLMELISVPRLDAKLAAMVTVCSFEGVVEDLRSACQVLTKACEEVRKSNHLTQLLQLVLTMGSVLNRNRCVRTQGFKLESLTKLGDIKSGNKKTTLLHYLASVIRKQPDGEDALDLLSKMPNIEPAAKIVLEALSLESRQLAEGLKLLGQELEAIKLEKATNEETKAGATQVLQSFFSKAGEEVEAILKETTEAVSMFKVLAEYFGEDESSTPSSFFGVLVNFGRALKKAHLDNMRLKKQAAAAAAPATPKKVLMTKKRMAGRLQQQRSVSVPVDLNLEVATTEDGPSPQESELPALLPLEVEVVQTTEEQQVAIVSFSEPTQVERVSEATEEDSILEELNNLTTDNSELEVTGIEEDSSILLMAPSSCGSNTEEFHSTFSLVDTAILEG